MRIRFLLLFSFLALYHAFGFAQQAIAEWHFDENTGLSTAESVSNATFAIKNDFPKMESERVTGVAGNALRLNGYATWVEGNLNTALPADQITITAWVAPEVAPFASAAFFTNVSGNTGTFLGLDNFGRLEIGAVVNGFYSQKISVQKLPVWQWSYVALTVDVSIGKLRGYINGALVAEQNVQAGSLTWPVNGFLKMGKHHNSPLNGIYETGFFCGLLDEVKMYGTALTQVQLNNIYQSENPATLPDMQIPISRFEGDPHRPVYHAIPAANWMNEPHGLFFKNGLYHIFYQKNGNGPYFGRLNWGHQTSPDLVTWTEQPVAISPDPGSYDRDGCWSGCSIIKDGLPNIMYTGVDGSAQMCLAEGNAEGTVFSKFANNPVVATPPAPYTSNDFRDPYIWEESGTYYMIIGSGLGNSGNSGGATLLYKSANLTSWQYLNVFHKGYPTTDNSGIFWEVPMFLTIGDQEVLTVQPVPEPNKPARILYWTGTFDNEIFTADSTKPKLLEPGDNLLGVTTTKDEQGRTIAIGIIPDILPPVEQQQNGWANLMSLPRIWSLSPDGKTLWQKPLPALEKLRGTHHHQENLSVAAGQNTFLPDITGRHLEIKAHINPGTASRVGIVLAKSPDNAERTRIYWEIPFNIIQIERSNSSINPNAPKGSSSTIIPTPQPALDLHIFLDGSVLEVFINDQMALSTRTYPELEQSIDIDLFTQGGTAIFDTLDIWEMKSMYDPTVTSVSAPLNPAVQIIQNIYPNPASGDISVQIELPESAPLEVQIMDTSGQVIQMESLGLVDKETHFLKLSGHRIPPGLYFIRFFSNGQMIGAGKIVKI